MISAVVLSMTWVELNVDTVRARLDKVFPGEFLPPRGEGTFVIEGPLAPDQYFVNSAIAGASGTFFLNSVWDRYAEVSDFADRIADEKLRALALAQEAWLSVDLINNRAATEGAWRFIGKTLAEFAPPDGAVLVHSYDHTVYFDETVRRRLANGDSFD